jgi:hypothetical protein
VYVGNVYAVNVAPLKWPRLNKCLIKMKLAERFGEEYHRNRVDSGTKHTQATIVGVELGLLAVCPDVSSQLHIKITFLFERIVTSRM